MSKICTCRHKEEYHDHVGDLLYVGNCTFCGIDICPEFVFSYSDSDQLSITKECENCHKMSRNRIQVYLSQPIEYPPYQMWCLECVRG